MNKTSSASIEAITKAIKALTDKGTKPTQKNVSVESGLSIRTVKTYWARVQGLSIDRVQETDTRVQGLNDTTPNRVQVPSTPFERLKRRNVNASAEIIPYRPWLNHIK